MLFLASSTPHLSGALAYSIVRKSVFGRLSMLLQSVVSWAPFRIDALGLVTLLGAEQAEQAVGRLAHHRFTTCLPLLGAFKIAGNDVVRPLPGFVLYNITDGIITTDLAGWFCRWLLSQDLTHTSTTLHISPAVWPRRRGEGWGNYVLGLLTLGPLLALAIVTEDWWGFANVASMVVSVVVRLAVVGANYAAINHAVDEAAETSAQQVKVLVAMPTGQLVTVRTSVGIILTCLATNPRPRNPRFYTLVRAVGWVSFGCHVISLGMAALINQLLSVTIMISATVLVVWQVGDDESRIGRHLRIQRLDHPSPDWRAPAMARLQLSGPEEDCLVAWHKLPQKSNQTWWQTFRNCQEKPELFKEWPRLLKDAYLQAAAVGGGDNKSAHLECKTQGTGLSRGSAESGDIEACVKTGSG